jgi:hypothetical protein
MKQRFTLVALTVLVMLLVSTRGSVAKQHEQQSPPSMAGMNMGQDSSPGTSDAQEMNAATQMMSSRHMDMGPHMKMTALRRPSPGDQERARKIVDEAREVMSKYQDYHDALADGFKIFLPNVPQQQYHFTNYSYGFEAGLRFNPEHPTSLLYDKTPDGYKLAGVMYTASAKANEDELNARVPLSVAQWHEHVNFCFPPKDRESEAWQKNPKFGMAGSISTKENCDQAGGRFVPLIFGWMVHVYPNEKNAADVWAMGPGMQH